MDHDLATPEPSASPWSPARRLAFRFAAVYFLFYSIYHLPSALGIVPELLYYHELWNAAVPWVGEHVLGIDYEIPLAPTGSGDSTADFVRLFMMSTLALIVSAAWSLVDRTRTSHPRFAAWLTVGARYWLGAYMVTYGFYKLFKLQFPFPDVVRLATPYGESSPMGLAWTFMGYSTTYNVFTGGVEVLGGMLLVWRRTTTLGALICAGAMANIVALNFGYDIGVKLFSTHLLLVALLLASQDARRLIDVLLLGRAAPARDVPPLLTSPRGRKLRLIGKGFFITLLLGGLTTEMLVLGQQYSDSAPTPPLYGLYEVSEHERKGDSSSATSERSRWRLVAIGRYGQLVVHPLFGQSVIYRVQVDGEAGTIALTSEAESNDTLQFQEPEPGVVVLEGSIDGVEHRATLRRVDEQEYLLVKWGFRWIQERPFNR